MRAHLDRDMERLKKDILTMGAMVEKAIFNAIDALVTRNIGLAEEVIASDYDIDMQEIEVEEDCLKILALYQPVAGDLRYIVSILKVNNDLERMGDLAGHIANRAGVLSKLDTIGMPENFDKLVNLVKGMVRDSLDALVHQDSELALKIIGTDDQVDELHMQIYRELRDRMRQEKGIIDRAFYTISVCRHLERIADYATNISEDIYFTATGEIIRHMDEAKSGRGDN
ncbi:MAG: phosphate signaling complex protein PhoU [bacterium]|nr:phosphate signaling complex protein PhoU [bacterium]